MINTPLVERFGNGQSIITEGIVSTKAYIILAGEVKIIKKVDNKTVVIGTLKKGDIFGEMGLLGNTSRTASVVAAGDVNLGVIDQEGLKKMLKEVPEELQLIFKALCERLMLTTGKLAHLAIQFENVKNTMNALSTKAHL